MALLLASGINWFVLCEASSSEARQALDSGSRPASFPSLEAIETLVANFVRDRDGALALRRVLGNAIHDLHALPDSALPLLAVRAVVDRQLLLLDYRRGDLSRPGGLVQPPGPTPVEPPRPQPPARRPDPVLVSVAFLDGSDSDEVAAATQVVNLPREAKFVDAPRIANLDRLGEKPRLKVRFDRPGAHAFRLRVKPAAGNAAYSGAELGRNGRFKHLDTERSFTTGGDGTKVIPASDVFVGCAGRNGYVVEAEDDRGVIRSTGTLSTIRQIWIVELKMRGLTTAATSLATLIGEYDRHGIRLVPLPAVEMPFMPNISTGDQAAFGVQARQAFNGSTGAARTPHALAIAYTSHLAVKNPAQSVRRSGVTVGPGAAAVSIPIAGPGLNHNAIEGRSLWIDLVPGEGWFVSASYLPAGGNPATDTVALAEARCTPVRHAPGSGHHRRVSVDVSALPAGTGTITLVVNWVDRMRAGIALSGNQICVCTRAWWEDIATASQNEVIVHELGHKVGMTNSAPAGVQLDPIATLYDDAKGHVGTHCHHGIPAGQARYDASADHALADCVMYGATKDGVSAFCANCAPHVRKMDISGGWAA